MQNYAFMPSGKEIVLHLGLLEDVVAAGFQIAPQLVEIVAQQVPFPLAVVARDHDRVDIGKIHQGLDGSGNVVEGRNVDGLGLEQDDIGVLAGGQAARLLIKAQALGSLDRRVLDGIDAAHQRREVFCARKGRIVAVHTL